MAETNNRSDLSLLARSLHNVRDIRRLLQEVFSNPEYDEKYIAIDIRGGKEGIRSFDDLAKAIEYRDSLPANLRFKLKQPILVRVCSRQY